MTFEYHFLSISEFIWHTYCIRDSAGFRSPAVIFIAAGLILWISIWNTVHFKKMVSSAEIPKVSHFDLLKMSGFINPYFWVKWKPCFSINITFWMLVVIIERLCNQHRARPNCMFVQSKQPLYCWLFSFHF